MTLDQKLYEENFSFIECILFSKHMVSALKSLKKLDIFHQDIKPKNIIYLHKENKYKLIDFGQSKCAKESESLDNVFRGCSISHASPIIKAYVLNSVNTNVNPFKAELYSMGLCFEKLFEKLISESQIEIYGKQKDYEGGKRED